MVDPLSLFSFQPVLHDWYNKGCGMCHPVCGMAEVDPENSVRGAPIICGRMTPTSSNGKFGEVSYKYCNIWEGGRHGHP